MTIQKQWYQQLEDEDAKGRVWDSMNYAGKSGLLAVRVSFGIRTAWGQKHGVSLSVLAFRLQ